MVYLPKVVKYWSGHEDFHLIANTPIAQRMHPFVHENKSCIEKGILTSMNKLIIKTRW
jgi:hypothetical protein